MQFGAIVDTLAYSQKIHEITNQMNKLENLDEHYDFILFYTSLHAINIKARFAMMDSVEIYGYPHPMIATSLNTAKMLKNCYSCQKKFFYMYDLEWMYSNLPYVEVSEIYMDERINLIARSDSHANIIEQCWKKPITVIEEFNYEQIIKTVNEI